MENKSEKLRQLQLQPPPPHKNNCAKLQEKRILKRKCFWRFFGGFAWFVSSWLRAIMLNWNIKEKGARNRRKRRKRRNVSKWCVNVIKLGFTSKKIKRFVLNCFGFFRRFFKTKSIFVMYIDVLLFPSFSFFLFPSVPPSLPCICCLVLSRSFCLFLCASLPFMFILSVFPSVSPSLPCILCLVFAFFLPVPVWFPH